MNYKNLLQIIKANRREIVLAISWIIVLSILTVFLAYLSMFIGFKDFLEDFSSPEIYFYISLAITVIAPILLFQYISYLFGKLSLKSRIIRVLITTSPCIVLFFPGISRNLLLVLTIFIIYTVIGYIADKIRISIESKREKLTSKHLLIKNLLNLSGPIFIIICVGYYCFVFSPPFCNNSLVYEEGLPHYKHSFTIFERKCKSGVDSTTEVSIKGEYAVDRNVSGNVFIIDSNNGKGSKGINVASISENEIKISYDKNARVYKQEYFVEGITIKYEPFENVLLPEEQLPNSNGDHYIYDRNGDLLYEINGNK